MVNLIHLCETMTTTYVEEEDLRVPLKTFLKFAERNNFSVRKRVREDKAKYKLVRKKIPVYFISGEEEREFKFLDLADIHIGHPKFQRKQLEHKLKVAWKKGVRMVFIAGDLFEGCCNMPKSQYIEQINTAFSIFSKYPFSYYAINGNHEYSFEQANLENPLKYLERLLNNRGIDFNYFDTYLMDFVICGVIKRVMHAERQDFNKRRVFPILKLKRFDEENMLQNSFDEEFFPVRFFQVGHIHLSIQMYYAKREIYISQSGSFIDNEASEDSGNILEGFVINQKVYLG